MSDLLVIDGAQGEGGGQILRTSLALAAVTGQSVRITNIRSGRRNPGLAAQHVVSCQALAEVCAGQLRGGYLHSTEVELHPGVLTGGSYFFDVSIECPSAGSTPLILQALLPALLFAPGPTTVTLCGGTDVPWSPVFSYLEFVFLPLVRRLGADLEIERRRAGWYPAGGGEIVAHIRPLRQPLRAADLSHRGQVRELRVVSLAERRLPDHILQRQCDGVQQELGRQFVPLQCVTEHLGAASPGTTCLAVAEFDCGLAGYTALGKAGKPAEHVGIEAGQPLRRFLEGQASVDEHLADQLLLYAALAAGTTTYITPQATGHLTTNALVVEQLLGVTTRLEQTPLGVCVALSGLSKTPTVQ